ncbi:tetratricopeptide repeat protein [uncultured Caballeronia sp.]|uniref:tetratricopeptide repeat protein n=1 Tax=uncultured Caballeronia sp. TaxID=1827198 RepID=UPI0015759074
MGRSITFRNEPMKPTSRRVPSVAKLAATALATAAFGLGATLWPVMPALAQVSTATADDTPAIDTAIAQKQWQSALIQLDARLATNPRDVQAKFKRATVLARLNRDDEAITAFTELTQTYPELPEPYNNLAALYAKEGRYDEARVALETATKANPSYALAYENLGDLYLRLASESYKRAQTLGSRSPLTAQRVGDIQKIVSPPPRRRPEAAAAAAAAASGTSGVPAASAPVAASSSATSNNGDWNAPNSGTTGSSSSSTDMSAPLYSPFGGPSVPLSNTPYFAPSKP